MAENPWDFIREPVSPRMRAYLYFYAKEVNLLGKSGKQAHHRKLHLS